MTNSLKDLTEEELSTFLTSTIRNEFEKFKEDIFVGQDSFQKTRKNSLTITSYVKNNEATIRRAFELYPAVFNYFEYVRKNYSLNLQRDAITQSMILFGESHKPGSFDYYIKAIEKKIIEKGPTYEYSKNELDEIFKDYENTLIFNKKENPIKTVLENKENKIETISVNIYTESEQYSNDNKKDFYQNQKVLDLDKEKKRIPQPELASVS